MVGGRIFLLMVCHLLLLLIKRAMTTTLTTLQHQREWISIEAFASLTLDIPDLLQRCLPHARSAFSEFIAHFVPSDKGVSLNRDQQAFMKVVEQHKYLDLAPTAAYVPEGLKVPYLHYINLLGPAVDHALKVQATLTTYTAYLALLLTNRDQRFSTKDSAVVYKAMEAKRTQLNADLGSCFNDSSHRTDVSYADVVERNTEWPTLLHAATALGTDINSVNRKILQKDVDSAVELIDRLIEMVQRGELKDASPNIALELSDGAYQVACELEFLAIVTYRVMALTTAINRTTTRITQVYTQ